jgi:hypothetical protein
VYPIKKIACNAGRPLQAFILISVSWPLQIRITGMLLKRGYLWPNERDDLTALRQAVILFIWDTLRKTPKPNRKAEDKEIVRTRPCAY